MHRGRDVAIDYYATCGSMFPGESAKLAGRLGFCTTWTPLRGAFGSHEHGASTGDRGEDAAHGAERRGGS